MKIIDARGETCPVPVILLKKALAEANGEDIREIVDNELSKQNLEKMLNELGHPFETTEENGSYAVHVKLSGEEGKTVQEKPKQDSLLVLSSDQMGRGEEELGHTLIKNFLYALTESDSLPQKIVLYNAGVKLACGDHEAVGDLKKLADKGVQIFACGLCLNYYGLAEKLQVGSVTNMYSIIQMKFAAAKIIQL
ncbi:MAG: sulfurtransferase-like selenium metabolism protein YedF [Eubacteriales bacterium]